MRMHRSPLHPNRPAFVICAVVTSLFAVPASANPLDFPEYPLAIEVGDTTLRLRGMLEQGIVHDGNSGNTLFPRSAKLNLDAERQLANSWTLRASVGGKYKSHPGSVSDLGSSGTGDKFSDIYRGSIGGRWGTIHAGNINDLTRNETSRKSETGNATLIFDRQYGRLSDWGVGYRGRFGPAIVSAVVDDDYNFDVGFRWSRPLGNKDYGFLLRGTRGTFVSHDQSTSFETLGIVAGADLIYGSSLFDVALGYEQLDAAFGTLERLYASAGLQHKMGLLTVSASAHLGYLDGQEERSLSLGGRYDISRGISANLGFNYGQSQSVANGIVLVDKDAKEINFSVQYDF